MKVTSGYLCTFLTNNPLDSGQEQDCNHSPVRRCVMQDYETRIITAAGKIALVCSASYVSDFTAIRAAQKMCRDGEMPEVWRGEVCVYAVSQPSQRAQQHQAPADR
jgi:hypothetical protein